MKTSKEIWRSVPNLPMSIQVSNKGNVREQFYKSDPIEFHKSESGGYLTICYKGAQYPIHRLVASAFIDNPDNMTVVNHIDGDKFNNCVDNLEWSSRSKGMEQTYKSGARGGIKIMCEETGKVYATIYSAHALTLIPKEAIVACADGKTDSCFGYHFKYVDDENHYENTLYRSSVDVISDSEKYESFEDYIKDIRESL